MCSYMDLRFASRPCYDGKSMRGDRARASDFAEQIIRTTKPWLPGPVDRLTVLDVGCGYGFTSLELSNRCRAVVGIEPCQPLFADAMKLKAASGRLNIEFRNIAVEEFADREVYDLAVLDNVLEHIPDHYAALRRITDALRPSGVLFIIVPNRIWPIEAHYGLPLLSYLPVRCASLYLQLTGLGTDYTDASYAPSYWQLKAALSRCRELTSHFVTPSDVSLARLGKRVHYRVGVELLKRWPWLWPVSKVFVVVCVKQ